MSKIRSTRDFRVAKKNVPTRILRENGDDYEPVSVPDLLSRTVENYGEHPAMAYLDSQTKTWKFVSYFEYKAKVEKIAKVFIKLGLKRWDSVGVLAFNSVEWFITELAAIHAG
jgi:long-chain-fatty-acid--CoA ligase ACSBG